MNLTYWKMNDLQLIIELFIRENGGREKLANHIECEWIKTWKPREYSWNHYEEVYLLKNYNNKSMIFIAEYLGRTYQSVRSKVDRLREKAIIDYKKYHLI